MSQSKIELFVNGPISGTTIGEIDLYGDEPISISYSITDIKDISKRNSSYSQNFTVPANKNNNILFNHIFNIGSDSSYDPSKKTPAYLLVDSLMVIQGNLQLTNIKVKNKNPVSYDVIIYGETDNLVKSLGSKLLTDLDISFLNHNKTINAIENSWSANTANLGYYYPLIDYGYDLDLTELNSGIIPGPLYTGVTSNGTGLNPDIFKPAISNKYLFDKIFNTAGFSYTSEFLNSEVFTETIIPFNGPDAITLTDDYLETQDTIIYVTGDTIVNNSLSTGNVTLPLFFGDIYRDIPNAFNIPVQEYVSPINSGQQFFIDLEVLTPYVGGDLLRVEWFRSSIPTSQFFNNIAEPKPYKVWDVIAVYQSNSNNIITLSSPNFNNPTSTYNKPLAIGERVWFRISTFSGYQQRFLSGNTKFYNIISPSVVANGPVEMNNYIPKKIKQIDYIKSIITMFNLMVIPSKNNPKNLEIIPRQDYFGKGIIKDWTLKLDVSQPVEELLINEQQNKQIKLSYKIDKDYFNTFYFDDTKKVYGEYIQTIDNEWLDPNSKQDIDIIFSPTPMENIKGTSDIIVPKIGKLDNSGVFGKTESNIRFLRKNPILTKTNGSTIKMLGRPPQDSYPYAGHLNHPFSGDTDYNFGTIDYAFYNTPGFSNLQDITPNNLVEIYWKEYLDDISDKNSKLIKCKIHLTPTDIAQFEYNDNIYIEGLTDDGGHYFIVNKITYTPTSNEPSLVELIKINRISTIKQTSSNLLTNRTSKPFNSIQFGDSETLSKNTIIIGNGATIGVNSSNTILIGERSTVGNDTINAYVFGNDNFITDKASNNFIVGNNNTILPQSYIANSATTINTAIIPTGVTIFDSNYTATTSNTVYVPNMQFTSTGSTINGVPVSAVTTSASLWTSGSTGIYNIKALNDTSIDATGDYSYAEGYNSIAIGISSHAEGSSTTAIGDGSHAEGESTTAFGTNSHSEGNSTTAYGNYSHAEGQSTTANGIASHSEGANTVAIGDYSHAGGIAAIANNTAEWVQAGASGYGQYGFVDFFGASTTAALGEMFIGGGVNERFSIPTDTAFRYRLNVIARVPATGDVKEWEALGLIKNVGGTTSIVGSSLNSTFADASLATASLAVSANNTNDALYVERTGIAATTIKWYGRLEYVKTL